MSAKSEVCRRKEIKLSQRKVGESPRMEKSRCEGCVVGRKGKHLERAAENLGQSTRICRTVFNVYMDALMKEVKMGIGRKGESGDCMASCMQITWYYVASREKV